MGANSSREESSSRKYRRKLHQLKPFKSIDDDHDTSPPPNQNRPTVNLVRHQVVLSDHVSPMSSLSQAITIPIRKTSWRRGSNNVMKRQVDNASTASSYSQTDEDDDDFSTRTSPRTSAGSDAGGVFKADESSSVESHNKKNYSPNHLREDFDIVFESKYANTKQQTKKPPKPFWVYNNGDEKEYDRQLRQHYVLKQILNGNIHVPIDQEKLVILDSACGAGFWAMDMAQELPNATVIGLGAFTDDYKRFMHANTKNVSFQKGDVTKSLHFPDNSVDIIYQRDTTSLMPHESWPQLLKEFKRITKPGGYVELVEYDFEVKNPGPVLALVNEWYKIASSSIGVDSAEPRVLEDLLTLAGFEQVTSKTISIPVGEWPEDQAEKEKGFLYKQVIQALFKSMKPWWIVELGVSEREYDKVTSAALDEFEEQRCSLDWTVAIARKPTCTKS
ncbi:S-adenosyl-L-methionine-dependent methyltransferase [Backusella circina FSU 941]|nr:S-adenosyl-L-methionine-dependent methyltransferase [Backusella circina FSU 941]